MAGPYPFPVTVCRLCGAFWGVRTRRIRGEKGIKKLTMGAPRGGGGGLSMQGEVTLNPFMTQTAQIQVPVRFQAVEPFLGGLPQGYMQCPL